MSKMTDEELGQALAQMLCNGDGRAKVRVSDHIGALTAERDDVQRTYTVGMACLGDAANTLFRSMEQAADYLRRVVAEREAMSRIAVERGAELDILRERVTALEKERNKAERLGRALVMERDEAWAQRDTAESHLAAIRQRAGKIMADSPTLIPVLSAVIGDNTPALHPAYAAATKDGRAACPRCPYSVEASGTYGRVPEHTVPPVSEVDGIQDDACGECGAKEWHEACSLAEPETKAERLLREAAEPTTADPMHPTGKCMCAGEGTCAWCCDAVRREDAPEPTTAEDTEQVLKTLDARTRLDA